VLYNDSLVDRQLYVSVDGGRMVLPMPERQFDGDPSANVVKRLTITPAQDAFFRVLSRLATSHDFDEYVRRAGLESCSSPIAGAWSADIGGPRSCVAPLGGP
jgi:hypothetical protein